MLDDGLEAECGPGRLTHARLGLNAVFQLTSLETTPVRTFDGMHGLAVKLTVFLAGLLSVVGVAALVPGGDEGRSKPNLDPTDTRCWF